MAGAVFRWKNERECCTVSFTQPVACNAIIHKTQLCSSLLTRIAFLVSFQLTALVANAQYFQYSQYNYSMQRINPAAVASTNYADVNLIHRNQATAGDAALKSSMVSIACPFVNGRTGKRWSGVGVSLLDDRAENLFLMQGVGLAYAINITPAKYRSLSIGFKGNYQTRRITPKGLTGTAHIPDRGFESFGNGENHASLRSEFLSFSSGVYWEQTDEAENRLAYWGVSFFDFNKSRDSFAGENELKPALVVTGGLRVFQHNKISVSPEVLFTRSASNNVANAGAITSYELQPPSAGSLARIDFLTKYVFGRSGIIGAQLHRENFSVGFSYDFPVVKQHPDKQNAFEIALQLRTLADQRLRRKVNPKMKPAQTHRQTAPKPVTRKIITTKGF